MPEATVEQEVPQFQTKERPSFRGRVKNFTRRAVRLVRKPTDISARSRLTNAEPLARIHPERDIAEAEKTDPDRAKKMGKWGCAVRAAMSATAHATGMKDIRATAQEWWARLKQMNQPLPPDTHQELLDLYKDYAEGNFTDRKETPFGSALKQTNVKLVGPQSEEQIKERIRKGEQVMVIIDEDKPGAAHIFHAGLDKKDRILALSDEKRQMLFSKKKRYERVKLGNGEFTTFTVTQKRTEEHIQKAQPTQNKLLVAA